MAASDILFWAVAAAATAMLGLFVLVLAGALPVEPPEAAVQERQAEPQPTPPAATPEGEVERTPSAAAGPATATARPVATVVVTATRGDCWLSARAGSADGRVLAELVLPAGETVRVRAPRVWLSLGAAGNVDVLVNGEPRVVPAGTVELVLEPRPEA